MNNVVLKPQAGFQEDFMQCSADILIAGGAAGAGKSHVLLMEMLRYVDNPKFGAVIFRRTTTQIRGEGGLWSKSALMYNLFGAKSKENTLEWTFKSGAKISFAHMEYDKNRLSWDGTEIAIIGFDEVHHFTETQFFYMLSRNRSTCGVRPQIRATCNPAPDSWLARFIEWWIDKDGFIIKERCGVLRFFTRYNDTVVWGNSRMEVAQNAPNLKGMPLQEAMAMVKSVTFIEGDIQDNKALLDVDRGYLANLMALSEAEKRRLLFKNWKIAQDDMSLCDFEKVQDVHTNLLNTSGAQRYAVCDHARFGKDLCTITAYEGLDVLEMHILTKSSTNDIVKTVNDLRMRYNIGATYTIVDQDGVGVIDAIGCKAFHGGGAPIQTNHEVKPNYPNLKTQCAYALCEAVNQNKISLARCKFFVDGQESESIYIGEKLYNIRELISEELRSIKRAVLKEGVRAIESKENQKALLGRSPDFADNLLMRFIFELKTPTRVKLS